MLIWGSISLAQSLIRERLVDEYRLIVCPIVLGSGSRLFSDGAIEMKLANAKVHDRGAAALTYVNR